MDPRENLRRGAETLERWAGGWKRRVKATLDLFEPPRILPFRGYGTSERLVLMGRVLEESGVAEPDRDAGFATNVLTTWRRLDSDELPGAVVEASFEGRTWTDRCDEEGYFRFDLEPASPLEPGWHQVEIALIESMAGNGARATGRILVPSPDAEFMVISDIDDTVIVTGAMDRLRMARTVFFRNAEQRTPFPGVVSFYQALLLGPDQKGRNPIFYLSRSGWSLYDLFDVVVLENSLPEGPLLLRDLHVIEKRSEKLGYEHHKADFIRTLLEMYQAPIVLIGDSGQQDPEIYHDILSEQEHRVAAVYIRHVVGAERAREIERMYRDHLGKLCLAPSTMEMARHALIEGLISEPQLEQVERGLTRDLE